MGLFEELNQNPYISNSSANETDKGAMSYTLLVLSLIANGKEDLLNDPDLKPLRDWVDGKISISGSVHEPNYRQLILLALDAKKKGYPLHPYLGLAQPVMRTEDVILRIDAFANDPYIKETFNMDAYLNTMCRVENGQVVGLKPEILKGQTDRETLNNLGEAFHYYTETIKSIRLDKNSGSAEDSNNGISK